MSYPQDVDNNPPAGGALQFATWWRRFLPFIVGGAGVILIMAGVAVNMWKTREQESIPQTIEIVKGVNTMKIYEVDISGAVVKPGVVEIPADSRIQDVLITAGGLDAKADRTYVSRYINLAQPIQDGMKIYVPFQGEAGIAGSEQVEASNSFNINNASQSKLEELPGVGPVTARKIIDGRPYGAIEELLSKKVISKSVFEKINDQITIY